MKHFILSAALMLLMPSFALAEVNIIPQPTRITENTGSYILKPNASIAYNDKSLLPAAEYLGEKLRPATGKPFNMVRKPETPCRQRKQKRAWAHSILNRERPGKP